MRRRRGQLQSAINTLVRRHGCLGCLLAGPLIRNAVLLRRSRIAGLRMVLLACLWNLVVLEHDVVRVPQHCLGRWGALTAHVTDYHAGIRVEGGLLHHLVRVVLTLVQTSLVHHWGLAAGPYTLHVFERRLELRGLMLDSCFV